MLAGNLDFGQGFDYAVIGGPNAFRVRNPEVAIIFPVKAMQRKIRKIRRSKFSDAPTSCVIHFLLLA